MEKKGKLELNGKVYEVTDTNDKIIFKDTTKNKIRVSFSFSKKKEDNERFEEGMKMFWTEVYS